MTTNQEVVERVATRIMAIVDLEPFGSGTADAICEALILCATSGFMGRAGLPWDDRQMRYDLAAAAWQAMVEWHRDWKARN